ncbi:geranylgeranylglyceryl/heptaprenylglyceryl phosphate synthase [Methanothermobacter tenebrarum]|uniref:Geranylgeranylglyceryl phosphate synthase n=1 Tax=Methanothermobacter tenebrarum TaxID=680118 RepID=A0A328PCC4_9EURY|nr:geranylgeranylglyceryl/heptaprenylglyceryl phosphate synthase [Methanothermobacter tenebrarum]MBC7101517.1 geranylgeranylglyceryl/heptaprenylglyceryl phosphate synthase [Methanobacteriales archaeon]NPV64404.1 geranylgeranylglyceryl/heptaprenylglyceryl phosphate synthase [Methanobacteriaceae archaeon]RAO78821.1 geranylgeranylglyceryl/heptaprenylglyceryl phosphate synthase [Methanothermobacter tenebrarum]
MKVEDYFNNILKERKMHLTLIDPEEQTSEEALKVATAAIQGGSDGIMLGGSTTDNIELEKTAKTLKENLDVPIILFPGNISGITSHADAIFFMTLLNSTNPYWIIGAQALAAPTIKKMKIEPIPMGYLVIEPGGTVGWVGDAKLVPREKPDIAAAYAMAAELLGMRLFYLEAGSGADKPVPAEMIKRVKRSTNLTLIVGGGIRTGEDARRAAKAGADIIVTGTIVENATNIKEKISEIVKSIRKP